MKWNLQRELPTIKIGKASSPCAFNTVLGVVGSWKNNILQLLTTPNNTQQGVQTHPTRWTEQCWMLVANNNASVCTGLKKGFWCVCFNCAPLRQLSFRWTPVKSIALNIYLIDGTFKERVFEHIRHLDPLIVIQPDVLILRNASAQCSFHHRPGELFLHTGLGQHFHDERWW